MSKTKTDLSNKYQKKTQYEHIVDLPDSYIGSVEKIKKQLYIFNDEQSKIIKREIDFIPGLNRIFEEVMLNAFDHQVRKNTGCNQIKIEVNQEEGWISVWNNGTGIPIQTHSTYKCWIPELIFCQLLTSSNYKKNEKRITGGKNGYGAKLTNIFSTKFIIESCDGEQKYVQIITDNMKKIGKPKISEARGKSTYTKIKFYPDFSKFNPEEPIDGFTNDMMAYMKKRAYDISVCSKKETTIFFNKEKIKTKKIHDYMKLYLNETEDKKFVYEEVNNRWIVGACLAEDGFEQISFVNGIETNEGGTHVNHVTNKLVKEIKDSVLKKSKTVKNSYIKDKIFVFISCFIENPKFNSQSKERLDSRTTSYGSDCNFSTKFIKDLMKTGIKEEVLAFTEFKDNKNLNKNDGKKVKNLYGIENYDKANWAGTNKSHMCYLILTEGLSAKGFAVNGLSVIGRDRYGIFPLRGKLINIKNKDASKVGDNKEITYLKKILGLQQNMTFKSKEDLKQLRYGGIIALTDQDYDGSHIKGLIMNAFHAYWKDLLKLGFIKSLATPILKAFKGKKIKKFYTESDYKKWKSTNPSGWKIKYYKGLGTHNDKEAAECFEDFENNLIHYIWDTNSDFNLDLAFKSGKDEFIQEKDEKEDLERDNKHIKWSNRRKKWLMDYNPDEIIELNQRQVTYSEFINKDLIHYSNDDTQRSIPSVMDGLKPSQRKILYAGLKRYKTDKKENRVAEFAGYVTYHSRYHHGEKSIIEATVKMAQTFVGSNNINYFLPNGNFGSRYDGPTKHASERYIHTNINPVVLDLFNINDNLVLDYNDDEGTTVEPKYYMPVVPMILVNGTLGIGTAFSSNVCSHRLEDVCHAIKEKMEGKDFPPLKPYFRGFQGRIIDNGDGKYDTIGLYKIVPDTNTIHIIELPIGLWTNDYKEFIEKKIQNQTKKKYITSYENCSTNNTIHFILKLGSDGVNKYSKKDYNFIIKDLNLKKSFSTNNMNLYDAQGVIRKFQNTREILEYFFNHRQFFYEERKKAMIKSLSKMVEKIKAQVKFIRYYNSKKIIVRKKSKAELEDQLLNYNFPMFSNNDDQDENYDYLTNMQIISLTNERAQQLENKYKQMENELDIMKKTTIKQMWYKDLDMLLENNKKYNNELIEDVEKEKEKMQKTRKTSSKKKKSSKKQSTKKKKVLSLDDF